METWQFDTTHSSIGFSVRHMVISKVHGRFTRWSGSFGFDAETDAPTSVDVAIEADSIDTNEPQRDAHLRSADFFDAGTHTHLRFRSTRVDRISDERFHIVGELTVHGVTHEVVLDTELGGRGTDPWGGERVGFSARTTINRRDWGLHWNQALEAGGLLVGEKVEITIEVQARKAAQAAA